MERTKDGFTSIGEAIGDKANRQLDDLVAKGPPLADFGRSIITSAKDCALITDQYVRENSWKVVGISAVVGLMLGFLLRRDTAECRQL